MNHLQFNAFACVCLCLQRWRRSQRGSQVSAPQSVAVSGSTGALESRPPRRSWEETSTGLCPGAPALYPAHCTAERVRTRQHWSYNTLIDRCWKWEDPLTESLLAAGVKTLSVQLDVSHFFFSHVTPVISGPPGTCPTCDLYVKIMRSESYVRPNCAAFRSFTTDLIQCNKIKLPPPV